MIFEILCLIPPLSQIMAVIACSIFLRIMWKTHIEMLQLRNELLHLQGKLRSLAQRHQLYLDKVEMEKKYEQKV